MDNVHLKPLTDEHSKAYGGSYKPKEPQGKPRKTICSTVRAFALDETTAHGFPNIYRAKTSLGRLLWACLFLAGVVGTFYQGTILILKYLSYPVNVEVKIVTQPVLEFPSVTVCNTNKLRHSAIERSRHKQMLVVDRTTSLPYYAPCLEDDVACEKRPVCIKRYLLCDGIRQCGDDDASDEQGCDYESRTCTDRQFRCGKSGSRTGVCLPIKKRCDRRPDCYEGEDEDDCPCKRSEFKCEHRGGCVARRKVCDGHVDCFDGSDESVRICGDQVGALPDCTSPSFFNCTIVAKCIPLIFTCDSFNDCPDASDEIMGSCLSHSPPVNRDPPQGLMCDPSSFACTTIQECVPQGWACDGSVDCQDGTDETLELCGRPYCTAPQVACPQGGCGTLCDLNPECANGWDEMGCTCQVLDKDTAIEEIHCKNMSSERFFGVYSECITGMNARDYRGTKTKYGCLPWSDPRVALLNYTGENYGELEGVEPGSTVGHSLCRNPGGERRMIWCFVDSGDGSLEYRDCGLPPRPPVPSCHEESFVITLRPDDGTGRPARGLVEVRYGSGDPGTISDRDWTWEDADVVCRQLGFPAGALAPANSSAGGRRPGAGRALLADVRCTGTEVSLVDCPYRPATERDTEDGYDVGVVCDDTDVPRRRRREAAPDSSCPHCSGRRRQADAAADVSTSACEPGEFECSERRPDGTTKCVPLDYVCDRYNDCGTAGGLLGPGVPVDSDEQNCTLSDEDCGNGNFKCSSGECIRYWQTCNAFPDCRDGSDERLAACEATSRTACRRREFQCTESLPDGTHRCIARPYVCDGLNDCGDNRGPLAAGTARASDERACVKPGEVPPANYYACRGGKAFIHRYDVCNTVEDCPRGDDENNCLASAGRSDPFRELLQDPQWFYPYRAMVSKEHRGYLFDHFGEQFRAPPFGRVKGDDPPDWNGFVTFSATPDYSDLVRVAVLRKDEVSRHGHQREDFILQCTYEQRKCNMSNFELLQDDHYGNCFTFNSAIDNPITAKKTSSRYGLQMTLFLEQHEYISIYGPEAGVRVSINPQHIRPNPTDSGITVKPGTVTSLGLRYNYVLRKGHPYGKCLKKVRNTKIIADGEIKVSSAENYDRELCKKTCIHEHIRRYCGCSDTLELNGEQCSLLNSTQEVCRQLIHFISQHNNLTCSCPQQCSEVYYTKTSSMSKWPSQKFAKHLLRNIRSINEKTQHLNEENLFDNIVRLEIYYEELNYESTKEVAAYQESSLFGDIGGIVGLYIGFSLITVCEFIALFLKLIRKSFCHNTVKI